MRSLKMPSIRPSLVVLIACLGGCVLLSIVLPEPAAKVDTLFRYWIPIVFAVVGFALVVPFLLTRRSPNLVEDSFTYVVAAMFFSLLVANVGEYLNVKLDDSPPKSETLVIQKKYLAARSSKPHRLRFSFGTDKKTVEIAVSREEYEPVEVGDSYTALVHGGAYGLRWISEYSRMRSNPSLQRTASPRAEI